MHDVRDSSGISAMGIIDLDKGSALTVSFHQCLITAFDQPPAYGIGKPKLHRFVTI